MSVSELLMWADNAGNSILWHIQEYRKTGGVESLLEIQHSFTEFSAVIDELVDHDTARYATMEG
jgi:hypothetical protein